MTIPQHPGTKRARALERDRALREREGLYLAWGIHLAQEALAAGAELRQALVGPLLERTPEGREVLRGLGRSSVPIVRTTTRALDSIIAGCGDQGVLLVVRRAKDRGLAGLLRDPPELLLLAHGVQDPGNLGSIIRTARALGCGALVALEGCADPFGSRPVRAAMGTQFSLPIVSARSMPSLSDLRRAGLQIVASDPAGTVPPPLVDFRRPTAVWVGGEGAGLPHGILEAAAWRIRIPMAPGVDSLNVHAAAVALLYEAARQREFRDLK